MTVHRLSGVRYILAVAVVSVIVHTVARSGELLLRLEEPAGLERKAWPVETSLPFGRGEVKDVCVLRVVSPSGENLPVQATSLSSWQDGSVRWAHILFFADMQAQKTAFWKVLWNSPLPPAQAAVSIHVTRQPRVITVNTGPLELQMATSGNGLIRNVSVDGESFLARGQAGTIRITNEKGEVFESSLEGAGDVTIEEQGPLRTIVRLRGKHRSETHQAFLDYSLRVIFYGGKTWCEIEHEFTNNEALEWGYIKDLSAVFPLRLGRPFTGTTSDFKVDKFWEFERSFRIYSGKDDLVGLFSGAKIFRDDTTEILGTGYESEARARFWADASDSMKGLTVSIQDMSSNYPKGIRAGPDGITLELYPSTETTPLGFHQGWRKRHRMLLFFHRGSARSAGSQELSFCWQEPVIPWTDHYVKSGVVGPLMAYKPEKYPIIERSLREAFVAYEAGVGRGMIDYGDTRGTGSGERAEFWANNAYDTPWAAYLMFYRTGERRYWIRAQSAAQHMMDIDIVHRSTRNPTEVGGVRIHGPGHVQYGSEAISGSSVAPNHEWAEGLLAAYHMTGSPDYLEAATGVADHILRAMDAGWILPPYNAKWNGARSLGWPLLLLSVVYDETGNSRYLDGARRIVGGLHALQMEDGSFPIWVGPYKASAPLHNAIAMEALGRFATMTGDTMARSIYLRCADATLGQQSFPDGDLMYITHPDYRSGYRSMPWGGFHYGYLFTHDTKYLAFPLPLVMKLLKSGNFGVYGEGAMSYPMRGMLFFLNYADEAGLLTDLPAY